MEQESYIVAISGEPAFETLHWGDWVDYLWNLGITNPGRAGFQLEDEDDESSLIEWYVR